MRVEDNKTYLYLMITIFNQDRPIQPFAGLNGVLLQQKQLQI
jgi:hypothetical protein